MSRRGKGGIAAALLVGAVAVAAALTAATRGTDTASATTTGPVATATVTRRDLVTRDDVDGTLGFADPVNVAAGTAGTVTWLPAGGAVVRRGQKLYTVGATPVRLLYGAMPMWRRLEKGVSDGADVEQLERNLLALGHDPSGMTIDDQFDGATANAVKDWQDDLGLDATGAVDPSQIVFLPGARRVGQLGVALGGRVQPGQTVVTTTATTPVVDIDLTATDQELARTGEKVTVELPSGRVVQGVVTEVGKVLETTTTAQGEAGDPTLPVTVTLTDPAKRDGLEGAPVTVSLERSRAEHVLALPVEALLALRGGGSALEVVAADGTHTLVAVEAGTFADGYVEVTGKAVRVGQRVVIPS